MPGYVDLLGLDTNCRYNYVLNDLLKLKNSLVTWFFKVSQRFADHGGEITWNVRVHSNTKIISCHINQINSDTTFRNPHHSRHIKRIKTIIHSRINKLENSPLLRGLYPSISLLNISVKRIPQFA